MAEEQPTTPSSSGDSKGASGTRIAIIVIIAIAVVGIGGWLISRYVLNKVAETATEGILSEITGGDVDVDSSGNTASISSEDGSFSMTANNEWPTDMPTEVPKFTAGEIDGSAKSTSEEKSSWTVSFTKVIAGAYDNYVQTLLSAGWSETSAISSDAKMSNMENDRYYLILTINETDQTGSLIVSEK